MLLCRLFTGLFVLWFLTANQAGTPQATSTPAVSSAASDAKPSAAVQSETPVGTVNKTEETLSSGNSNSVDQSATVSETVTASVSEAEQQDANKTVTVEDSDDESSAAKMEVEANAEANHQTEEPKEEVHRFKYFLYC